MLEILAGSIPYLLWVLLPLVPAILIFRIFPQANIIANGPMGGLSVKASGAIAAYLVVFGTLSIPVLRTGADMMTNLHHHFWTVEGRIKLFDGKGHDVGHELEVANELKGVTVTATTTPQPYHVDNNLFIGNLVEDALDKLPQINIAIDGFVPTIIDLNDHNLKATKDEIHKRIVIESIAMDKRGAFLPNTDVSSKLDTISAAASARSTR